MISADDLVTLIEDQQVNRSLEGFQLPEPMQFWKITDIQSGAVLMQSNLTWYCVQYCSDRIRAYTSEFKLARDIPYLALLSWAKWCLLWEFWLILTALYCHCTAHIFSFFSDQGVQPRALTKFPDYSLTIWCFSLTTRQNIDVSLLP